MIPLEVRRKAFHMGVGLLIALGVFKGFYSALMGATIVISGLFISRMAVRYKLPVIEWFLDNFDRPEERKTFPGKGAFYLFLGTSLAILLFPRLPATGAIIILSVGDAFAHVIGKYVGRFPSFINAKKNVEGTIAGIILGTMASAIITPVFHAFLATFISLTIELFDIRIGNFQIDDNLTIPLIAGMLLWLLAS